MNDRFKQFRGRTSGRCDAYWFRFFCQVQRDLKFWLFGIAFFALFRGCLIIIYRDDLSSDVTVGNFLTAFLNGMSYDSMMVRYCKAPLSFSA